MSEKKNKPTSLNWDEFKALGNPENIEEFPAGQDESSLDIIASQQKIRIYLDRKKRKGKGVTVISGLEADDNYFDELTRELKKSCGVGGSWKEGLILIQGDHRNRLKEVMIRKGFKDTKISGA